MSFSHFGKSQSTLLVAVVFYLSDDNQLIKVYYDFISEYLGHNSTFYSKCLAILLEELKIALHFDVKALFNVTDGGSHFVSRFAFWSLGEFSSFYGKDKNIIDMQILQFTKLHVFHNMAKENVMDMELLSRKKLRFICF